MMAAHTDSRSRSHRGQTSYVLRARPQFYALVDAAATIRGVSRSVYLRRTSAVTLAHDLGIDVTDALRFTAHWRNAHQDKTAAPRDDRGLLLATTDDAYGIADWCPHPGCDGAHLLTGPFAPVTRWVSW